MQMGGGMVGSAVAAGLFHDPMGALGALLPLAAALACLTYYALPMESGMTPSDDRAGDA